MIGTVDALSLELLERLTTEERRPPSTPGTHLVGGFVKAGAKLEALLRSVVLEIAETDGVDPSELLAPTIGRAPPLQKAMAGPLAHGIKAYVVQRASRIPLPQELLPLIDDLSRSDSRIFEFINARNKVAKEGKDPELARVAIRNLRNLVGTFRRSAGWSGSLGL